MNANSDKDYIDAKNEATRAGLDGRLAAFEENVNGKFAVVNQRFATVDERFDAVDARFDAVDSRFDAVDARFEVVNSRFDIVDSRFDAVYSRLDIVDSRFGAVYSRFDIVDSRFDAVYSRFDIVDSRINELRSEVKSAIAHASTEMVKWMAGLFVAMLTIFLSSMVFIINTAIARIPAQAVPAKPPVVIQPAPAPASPPILDEFVAPSNR